MKYTYEFINGEKVSVEIDENTEWGQYMLESDRKMANGDRREHYHSAFSIDGSEYEGETFADRDADPYCCLMKKESSQRVDRFLAGLTEVQRRRTVRLDDGLKTAEIAREEGCAFNTVKESIEQVRKIFRKNFPDTPQ